MNPETLEGLLIITGTLILIIPVILTILIRDVKFAYAIGIPMGFFAGNFLALNSPAGWMFFLAEISTILIVAVLYIVTHTSRTVHVHDVGTSQEIGPGWWFKPPPISAGKVYKELPEPLENVHFENY